MTARKISDLPAAATPLTGAEVIPGVQTGASVRVAANDLVELMTSAPRTWGQTQTFTVPPEFTDGTGTRSVLAAIGLATQAGAEALTSKIIDGRSNSLSNLRACEGLRNFDKRNYMRLRSAIAKAQAGVGQAKIACVGDSITAGYGAGGAGANHTGGARPLAYPAKLARFLTDHGVPAAAQSIWGWAGLTTTTDINAYDTRLNVSSSWSASPFNTLGGALLRGDSTGTGLLSFTPSEAVDTFDVYYCKGNGNGAFNANIDGGANVLTDENSASSSIAKLTITAGSAGTHTLNLARASGGNVYIIGIHAYDSTTKKVHLLNMGWGGSTSAKWNDSSQVWSPKVALATVAPDAVFLMLGANDMHAGTTDMTFDANISALVSTWKATADIVLVNFPPCASAWPVAPATRPLYLAKLQALADANNLALLDLDYLQLDYTTANGYGLFDTSIHPSAAGYSDIARQFFEMMALF